LLPFGGDRDKKHQAASLIVPLGTGGREPVPKAPGGGSKPYVRQQKEETMTNRGAGG